MWPICETVYQTDFRQDVEGNARDAFAMQLETQFIHTEPWFYVIIEVSVAKWFWIP